jgi:hypothetical protein
MKLRVPSPNVLTIGLLAGAVVFGGLAWHVQSDAAAVFEEAIRIQNEEVPESDAAPPDIEDNQAIIETVERSIVIRKQVDGLLGEVEELVDSLQQRQVEAVAITALASRELSMIARNLDSSATSAQASSAKLAALRGHLTTSARLAALIAEELEELDRSFGPSVGSEP